MNSITTLPQRTQKKQVLTCQFCGFTGLGVKTMDYYDTISKYDTVRDLCVDFGACKDRQLQKMAEIDKQIDIRQGSSEYLAECRRIMAVEG